MIRSKEGGSMTNNDLDITHTNRKQQILEWDLGIHNDNL